MAFKSATGKVLTLIKACLPENSFVKKRLLIEEILEMQSYRELKVYEPTLELFKQFYGKESLLSLSFVALLNVKDAIPVANELLPVLVGLKNHGDVTLLKPEDKPDLYSKDSLTHLLEKISGQAIGQNITNIADSEIMLLFDTDTVVDPTPYVGQVDAAYSNTISDGLGSVLSGRKYCIQQNLVDNCQIDISAKIDQSNLELKRLNQTNAISRRHRAMLGLIIGVSLMILLKILGTAIYGYLSAMGVFSLVFIAFIVWG